MLASLGLLMAHSTDGDASTGLGALDLMAATDVELARKMAGLWLADGVHRHETDSLGNLHALASKDIEFATRIANFSWLADGVTSEEAAALRFLNQIADSDVEFAREVSGNSWFEDRGTLASYVLGSLIILVLSEPDALGKLTGQPWFADGLDEEEAALVVTLGWVARQSPELYADLLRTHYTKHRAVSLPLAGGREYLGVSRTLRSRRARTC